MILYGLEAYFKYHYNFQMWGMNRKDVMEEFPFPDIREGLAFFPEIVIFQEMGMKYKARYINPALRAYFKDQENSTTYKKRNRSKENIYLWQYYLNNALHYFFYSPIFFIKSFVGFIYGWFYTGNVCERDFGADQ